MSHRSDSADTCITLFASTDVLKGARLPPNKCLSRVGDLISPDSNPAQDQAPIQAYLELKRSGRRAAIAN